MGQQIWWSLAWWCSSSASMLESFAKASGSLPCEGAAGMRPRGARSYAEARSGKREGTRPLNAADPRWRAICSLERGMKGGWVVLRLEGPGGSSQLDVWPPAMLGARGSPGCVGVGGSRLERNTIHSAGDQ
eukprot:10579456-Heterocapsa_arctica.AAC.1